MNICDDGLLTIHGLAWGLFREGLFREWVRGIIVLGKLLEDGTGISDGNAICGTSNEENYPSGCTHDYHGCLRQFFPSRENKF